MRSHPPLTSNHQHRTAETATINQRSYQATTKQKKHTDQEEIEIMHIIENLYFSIFITSYLVYDIHKRYVIWLFIRHFFWNAQ